MGRAKNDLWLTWNKIPRILVMLSDVFWFVIRYMDWTKLLLGLDQCYLESNLYNTDFFIRKFSDPALKLS